MKNVKLIVMAIAAVVFFESAVFAQIEKQIAAIRAEVRQINNGAAKYAKKTKNLDKLSTEGAEVTYYTSGKGLKKIVAKIYGESGGNINEYFYSGENLIFVFQKANYYDKPIDGGRTPKVVRVKELRVYMDGGNCIRLLNGKKMMKPDSIEFTEEVYAIIETADQIKGAYEH